MSMNPLPPQAYTKDTLQRAYAWLLSQSPSVKELASSQDMLISLYLKAQRNGDASLEAPHIQNFKQDLKSLATMIGDFSPVQSSSLTQTHQPPPQYHTPPQQQLQVATASTSISTSTSTTSVSSTNLSLDTHSLNAVTEVRKALNLTSDYEALRALIAIGYKHFNKF